MNSNSGFNSRSNANNTSSTYQFFNDLSAIIGQVNSMQSEIGKTVWTGVKGLPDIKLFDQVLPTQEALMDCNLPVGTVPSQWQLDNAATYKRAQFGEMDLRYNLITTKNEKIVQEETIGRKWTPIFEANFNFLYGDQWGNEVLPIQPAFAGVAEEIIDRNQIAMMQGLSKNFSDIHPRDFTNETRTGMAVLAKRPINAVRFLHRAAALYIGLILGESAGVGVKTAGPIGTNNPISMVTLGNFNTAVYQAVNALENVVYFESNVGQLYSKEYLDIMYLLCCSEPNFVGEYGMQVPTVLNYWPEISNTRLVTLGMLRYEFSGVSLSSSMVYNAVINFVRMHDLQVQWEEALQTVAFFATRPEGDTLLSGATSIQLSLPEPMMQSYALGMISAPVRQWLTQKPEPMYTAPHQLIWDGAVRYMTYAVCLQSCILQTGMGAVEHVDLSPQAIYTFEKAASTVADGKVPLNILAQSMAYKLNWRNLLGRILCTMTWLTVTQIKLGVKARFITPLLHQNSIQWEETLPFTDTIADNCGVYGQLCPIWTINPLPPKRWHRINGVTNRVCGRDAFYSMEHHINIPKTGSIKFAWQIFDSNSQSYAIKDFKLRKNYRGQLCDSQFQPMVAPTGQQIHPVFQIQTPGASIMLNQLQHAAQKLKHFVTYTITGDDDQALQEAKAAAFPPATGIDIQQNPLFDTKVQPASFPGEPEVGIKSNPSIQESMSQKRMTRDELKGYFQRIKSIYKLPGPLLAQVDALVNLLGMQPQWVKNLLDIHAEYKGNYREMTRIPLEHGIAQAALQDIKETPPANLLYMVEMDRRQQAAKLIGNLLVELSKWTPAGSSQSTLFLEAATARALAAQLAFVPALNKQEYDMYIKDKYEKMLDEIQTKVNKYKIHVQNPSKYNQTEKQAMDRLKDAEVNLQNVKQQGLNYDKTYTWLQQADKNLVKEWEDLVAGGREAYEAMQYLLSHRLTADSRTEHLDDLLNNISLEVGTIQELPAQDDAQAPQVQMSIKEGQLGTPKAQKYVPPSQRQDMGQSPQSYPLNEPTQRTSNFGGDSQLDTREETQQSPVDNVNETQEEITGISMEGSKPQ